jgi:hypothetical protein
MGDIVLTTPRTLPQERHVPAIATRLRINSFRWAPDSIMVFAFWVDEAGEQLAAVRVGLGSLEAKALRNTKVTVADDGKSLDELIEKKLRRLVKTKMELEGTTP